MLSINLQEKIRQHALLEKPDEVCGLLLNISGKNDVFPCKNISSNRKKFFEVSPLDYLRASQIGKIYGFYHSQKSSIPSDLDKMQNKVHNLESYFYSIDEDKIIKCEGEPKRYVDKEFKIGKSDCFTLVRNYYKDELKIHINDYPRDEDWFRNNPNIFFDNFEKEGFKEVDILDLRRYDVLIFDGHLALYVGDNIILHHPRFKYSLAEPLIEPLKRRIKKVVRHKLFF